MSNVSISNSSYPPSLIFVSEHVMYATIGTLALVSNLTIIAAWSTKKSLRIKKEMVLIIALAVAEATFGLGHILTAADRFPHFLSEDYELVSYLHCFFRPHSILWTFGALGSASMQVVISIDRYMAIRYFSDYMAYGRGYAIKLACSVGAWVTLVWLLFFIDLYINVRDFMTLPVCWDYTRFTSYGYKIYWAYLTGASMCACLTYLVVMRRLKRQSASWISSQSQQQQTHINYQTKVTKLLGMVTLCTALLFVAPSTLYFAMRWKTVSRWIHQNVINIFLISGGLVCIMSINSCVNIVVYFVKNRELRSAIMDLVRCGVYKKAMENTVHPLQPATTDGVSFRNREEARNGHSLHQQQQNIPMANFRN